MPSSPASIFNVAVQTLRRLWEFGRVQPVSSGAGGLEVGDGFKIIDPAWMNGWNEVDLKNDGPFLRVGQQFFGLKVSIFEAFESTWNDRLSWPGLDRCVRLAASRYYIHICIYFLIYSFIYLLICLFVYILLNMKHIVLPCLVKIVVSSQTKIPLWPFVAN